MKIGRLEIGRPGRRFFESRYGFRRHSWIKYQGGQRGESHGFTIYLDSWRISWQLREPRLK